MNAALAIGGVMLIVSGACGVAPSDRGAASRAQTIVLTDAGSSTAPAESSVGSARDYLHTTRSFATGDDWTITWSSAGQFAVIAGYLVVGQPTSGGLGSGTVHMRGAGQHRLSILAEHAYSVVVRSG